MSLTLRILIGFLLLGAIAWFAVVNPVLARVERQYYEAAEEPMVDLANLLAEILRDEIAAGPPHDHLAAAVARTRDRRFEAPIYDLLKTRVELHVCLSDANGVVIFDSAEPSRAGKPHGFRDVRLTLEGGYGARTSLADPDDPLSSVMHVAAPVLDNAGILIGVVSVSKPQRDLLEFIRITRARVTGFALTGAALALALGLVFSRWITAPLRALTRHAEAVAAGRRPTPPRLPGRHFRRLGQTVEDMRDALEGRRHVESYVRNLSHEMKSPVAAIRGAAELLENDSLPPERRALLLENIRNEGERLHQLGDQLLALATLESRKQPGERHRIALAGIIADTTADHQGAADSAEVSLEMDTSGAPEVEGDAALLKLALSSLLRNAVEFSPPGGRVRVTARREGGDAVIEVEDDGPGLPDFALDRAFERFFSLPRPRSGRKSSGLGLCLARETAELHGGGVTLENRTPTGARATLRLPAAKE